MKNTVKAEMWDKMQFLFRNYYDRMIHAEIAYDGTVIVDTLSRALRFMVDNTPVLHSHFVKNPFRPYWKVCPYEISDVLKVIVTEDVKSAANSFLTDTIDLNGNVQIRVGVITDGRTTVLASIVNHMCMDGNDFKYFITELCVNYNKLISGDESLRIKTGSRDYRLIYEKLNESDKKKAENLYKNTASEKNETSFPWAAKSADDKNIIVKREISAEDFAKMHAVCKKYGATVNDGIMTLAVRALYDVCHLGKKDKLTVACAVDLRRHVKDKNNCGLANHIAWMPYVSYGLGGIEGTLEKVADGTRELKRDKFLGLYSLPLLALAYKLFPNFIAEILIKIGYANPLIALSNIGIMDGEKLTLNGSAPVNGFMTGAVKFKPYFLLSYTTLNGRMTLSTAIRGNTVDEFLAERFLEQMETNLKELLRA